MGKVHARSGGNELVYWLNISGNNIRTYKAPSNYCEWFVSSKDAICCQERRLFLICEACVAVRFCQRKDGLSYLVIGQLWIQLWAQCGDTGRWAPETAFAGRVDGRILCLADPLPSPFSPVRSCPEKYVKAISSSALWGCRGFGTQLLSIQVGPGRADSR